MAAFQETKSKRILYCPGTWSRVVSCPTKLSSQEQRNIAERYTRSWARSAEHIHRVCATWWHKYYKKHIWCLTFEKRYMRYSFFMAAFPYNYKVWNSECLRGMNYISLLSSFRQLQTFIHETCALLGNVVKVDCQAQIKFAI